MKSLSFAAFLGVAYATSAFAAIADETDPVGWAQRCFANSKGQLDWVSERQWCIKTILGYCEFAEGSRSCYGDLTTNFENRSQGIIDGLPQDLSGPAPQKKFYENRLELLNEATAARRCETSDVGTECAAFVSLGRYIGALSLVDWVKQERTANEAIE